MDQVNEYGYLTCTCEHKLPRKKANQRFGLQCQNCGKWEPKSKGYFGFNWPTIDFDESISAKFRERWDRQQKRRQEELSQERDSRQAQWREYYDWYMQSPEWKAKRREVLERDNYVCCGCRKRKATQVHHLTYDHLGQELLWELVSVCDECHQVVHPHMRVELVNINWETFR